MLIPLAGSDLEELKAILGDLQTDLPVIMGDLYEVWMVLSPNQAAWHRVASMRVRMTGLQGEVNRAVALMGGTAAPPRVVAVPRPLARVVDVRMRQANDHSMDDVPAAREVRP